MLNAIGELVATDLFLRYTINNGKNKAPEHMHLASPMNYKIYNWVLEHSIIWGKKEAVKGISTN